MEKEVWKFIDDRYQISNYGNFRKNYKNKIKNIKVYENSNGYLKAKIYKNCKYKHKMVHRLVAKAFIPNPNNYPVINHIDGNKKNNKVNNLEWCTYRYNSIHAKEHGLLKNNIIYAIEAKKKPVNQYDIEGHIIKKWNSVKDASETLKINPSNICYVCKSKRKTAGGFVWKYEY